MSGKVTIKSVDMADDMHAEALELAAQAMEKFHFEKDMAAFIKKEFDKKYNPTWHCIVGRNFGCYVSPEARHVIYFDMMQTSFLLFRAG
jgi:dynein light chain LC8-type